MLKSLLYNCIFIIILIVATFLLGEVVLRVYNYFAHSHIFYDDSYNRYRGKPHVTLYGYKLNAGGFNDKEFTAKPGDYRIIGLGDSFAFGIVPQGDTYLTKLETKLNQQVGPVSLFNMGISQTNPTDYYSILTNEGADLKPDLVLLSFFVGNDFDVIKKRWFFRHSYMLTALNYIAKVTWKVNDFAGHQPYCDSCRTFNQAEYLRIEKDRLDAWKYHMPDSGSATRPQNGFFEQTVATLLRIRDYCKQQGAKFMIVIIPDELQVSATLQQDMIKAYYEFAGKLPYDVMTPTRLLSEQLRSNQIPYIDLYEPMRKAAQEGKQLYKPSDSHWNIAGNEFAAQILTDSLAKVIPKKLIAGPK
ncbi:hypothetical protein GCM10027592_03130 [Spirosoma flavus]